MSFLTYDFISVNQKNYAYYSTHSKTLHQYNMTYSKRNQFNQFS